MIDPLNMPRATELAAAINKISGTSALFFANLGATRGQLLQSAFGELVDMGLDTEADALTLFGTMTEELKVLFQIAQVDLGFLAKECV